MSSTPLEGVKTLLIFLFFLSAFYKVQTLALKDFRNISVAVNQEIRLEKYVSIKIGRLAWKIFAGECNIFRIWPILFILL